MKKLKLPIIIGLIFSFSVILAACGNTESGKTLQGSQASFEGFTEIDSSTYSLTVPSTKSSLDLNDMVEVNSKSSWTLSSDIHGNDELASKIVALETGGNIYYVWVSGKNNVKIYTLQIKRNREVTITFNSNGGSLVASITQDEGSIVLAPANPTRINYQFISWQLDGVNYSFNKMPDNNIILVAVWRLFDGGKGTVGDPYIISTSRSLKLFSNLVNSGNAYSGMYFELGGNIDLGGEEWTPIGYIYLSQSNFSKAFQGNFDGKNYTVSNFIITQNNHTDSNGDGIYAGLFGCIYNANIQNIGVTELNIEINSSTYINAGGLVGYNCESVVTNCYVTGTVSASSSNSNANAGGLVGYNVSSTIRNCYSEGDISIDCRFSADAGGLVGYNYESAVINCYVTGTVSASSSNSNANAGGLVGYNSRCTITKSYATGDIWATSSSGGLVGWLASGEITNCYAMGQISASSSISTVYAGGLVGYNSSGEITSCYATGDTSASSTALNANAGGLVGYNSSGTATSCYVTGNISAVSSSYNANAGDLAGRNSGAIINCYGYSGQIFYRKQGSSIYSAANEISGSACTVSNLNSDIFFTGTLIWNADVWDFNDLDFSAGKFPMLKAFL